MNLYGNLYRLSEATFLKDFNKFGFYFIIKQIVDYINSICYSL